MVRIQLENVTKSFGKVDVIKDISLAIEDGEFVVFVGPSGCGKSTLLRIIAGLTEVTGGTIVMDGERVNDRGPAQRGIAMVFQSYALYPHMTVGENIGFGLKIAGRRKDEIRAAVIRVAESLQLTHLLERMPRELSGGQRQRVAIGRAIVRDPKVFLFDEPLSNLDAELRIEMRQEIAQLHRTLGTSMIYVTHDQVEAMTLADKIVVLRDGRVEQIGAPLELYQAPVNEFVAGFLGSPKMNFIDVRPLWDVTDHLALAGPDGTRMDFRTWDTFQLPSARLGVRPDAVVIADQGLPFVIANIERLGNGTYLFGQFCGTRDFKVHLPKDTGFSIGQTLAVELLAEGCHLFDGDGQRLSPNIKV